VIEQLLVEKIQGMSEDEAQRTLDATAEPPLPFPQVA
jgi:hypothetical protein